MLGRYEVVRLLSVGGMAEIYLARSAGIHGFEKLVVIKRMLPHFAVQASYVQMFLAEARLAAMLDHTNIVQVHDIGEETGNYYYAMEYMRGGDLRDLMRIESRAGRAMPLSCAVAIGLGMTAGLEHAHSLCDAAGQPIGIVHRDVSLSNVLVSFDGAVKVTDFGVAKISTNEHRTRTGTLKGKIGYMSPEQCRGAALDRRSDIFSIGIILYELTTGKRLFAGAGTELVVLQKIVGEDAAPPSKLRPGYSPALEAIVMRALQRDRRLRYQTARDMQRDLEALARSEQLSTSPIEVGEYVAALLKPADGRTAPTEMAWAEADDDDELLESVEIESEGAPVAAVSPDHAAPRSTASVPDLRGSVRRRALAAVAVAAMGAAAAVAVALWPGASATRAPGRASVVGVPPAPAAVPDRAAEAGAPPTWSAPAIAVGRGAASPAPALPAGAAPAVAARDGHAGVRDRRVEDTRRVAHAAGRAPARERDVRRLASSADPKPASWSNEDAMPPTPAVVVPIDAAPPPPIDASPPIDAPNARPVAPPPLAPVVPRRAPTGSLDAAAGLASVEVQGPLQDSEIRRGVERVLPAFRQCYQQAARAAQRTPTGQVRIGFEIDATRTARAVRVGGEPLPGVGACMRAAAGRIRTRLAPDVGNAQVTVVITFAPT